MVSLRLRPVSRNGDFVLRYILVITLRSNEFAEGAAISPSSYFMSSHGDSQLSSLRPPSIGSGPQIYGLQFSVPTVVNHLDGCDSSCPGGKGRARTSLFYPRGRKTFTDTAGSLREHAHSCFCLCRFPNFEPSFYLSSAAAGREDVVVDGAREGQRKPRGTPTNFRKTQKAGVGV